MDMMKQENKSRKAYYSLSTNFSFIYLVKIRVQAMCVFLNELFLPFGPIGINVVKVANSYNFFLVVELSW